MLVSSASGRDAKTRSLMSPIAPRAEDPKPAEPSESPLPNAWPTGLRTMRCLACDALFPSSGRHERLCPSCRRRKA